MVFPKLTEENKKQAKYFPLAEIFHVTPKGMSKALEYKMFIAFRKSRVR